jgi:WS/DGAT/MGAT family acyltransferase
VALVSLVDVPFLLSESRDTPMHVGGLQVFELPPDAPPTWLRQQFEAMIAHPDLAPLFRKRPYRSARTGFQWAWRDDDELDIEYHVRHSALPEPGRVRELLALGSRLHGSLLDRQRPLWQFHLIEGLEGNRFAAYTKIHHSVVDGVSALRILERSLSTDARATVPPPWAARERPPKPEAAAHDGAGDGGAPSPLALVADAGRGVADLVGVGPALLRSARRAMSDELAGFPFKAPASMFNVHITGSRRIAADTWSFSRVKAVAKASDATLNDIVLAMCGGALRRYLLEQDALPDESLTSMVPVSLRTDDSAGGNAVGAVITSLATDIADASWRLDRIKESMAIAKGAMAQLSPVQRLAMSAFAVAPVPVVSLLGGGEGFRPPFNITISNVPGPRQPLFLNGARLQGVYPASIPYHGQALNITLTSYVDNLEIGLTGCRRRVPHLQRLLAHLESSLVELEQAVGLAGATKPKRKRAPKQA